jgi:hypothetical protein
MSSIIPAGWTLKATRAYMARESARYGEAFEPVPTDGARRPAGATPPIRVLRNRHFMVQEFAEPEQPRVLVRLSINRTVLNDRGEWLDGITWDQLQSIKNAVGYADYDALEVYPRKLEVVNVANIRHLWVMRELVEFAWGNGHGRR